MSEVRAKGQNGQLLALFAILNMPLSTKDKVLNCPIVRQVA